MAKRQITRTNCLAELEDLSDAWQKKLLSIEKENSSDFEKQIMSDKVLNTALAVIENDSIHMKMVEFEPLLEASEERNLRSINWTLEDYPRHCEAQTVWKPERSYLCLIWDDEEFNAIGLPDHQ